MNLSEDVYPSTFLHHWDTIPCLLKTVTGGVRLCMLAGAAYVVSLLLRRAFPATDPHRLHAMVVFLAMRVLRYGAEMKDLMGRG